MEMLQISTPTPESTHRKYATSNLNNHSIFNRLSRSKIFENRSNRLNYYFIRGVAFYHIGNYRKANADFSKALRLDWRNERVVLWIDRAERAHRITLCRLAFQAEPDLTDVLHPLSAWDRPTCHRFTVARI
jgi:hypothetical protein